MGKPGTDGAAPALDRAGAELVTHHTNDRAQSERLNERYRWRCYLCRLFAKQYQPDAERVKQAQDFAYSRRQMINESFDRGLVKAVVLSALRLEFETASPAALSISEAETSLP